MRGARPNRELLGSGRRQIFVRRELPHRSMAEPLPGRLRCTQISEASRLRPVRSIVREDSLNSFHGFTFYANPMSLLQDDRTLAWLEEIHSIDFADCLWCGGNCDEPEFARRI